MTSGQVTRPTYKSARRTGWDATLKEILGQNDGRMLEPRIQEVRISVVVAYAERRLPRSNWMRQRHAAGRW